MPLRPEYSLGHSAYNDFLFGSVSQDAAGTEVTVLSALSRLGIDPGRRRPVSLPCRARRLPRRWPPPSCGCPTGQGRPARR